MNSVHWVCPFCALHCDDLKIPETKNKQNVGISICSKAYRGFSQFNFENTHGSYGYINGKKAKLDNLLKGTSNILSSSKSPFFGGLGLDILGSRSVIKLARHFNATVDHMHGNSIAPILKSLQTKGTIFTTLSEIKSRADLLVFLKSEPTNRMPRFSTIVNADNKRTFTIKGKSFANKDNCESSILEQIRLITYRFRNNLGDDSTKEYDVFFNLLQEASYTVFIWDPQEFDKLAEYMATTLTELVKQINQNKRAGILTLGSDNGGLGLQNAISWMTSKSIRSSFSENVLNYQPELFSLDYCLKLKSIDSIFWFSCFCDELPVEEFSNLPVVAFGPVSMGEKYTDFFKSRERSIFFPIATPGVNTSGYIMRCDGAVISPLKKIADDNIQTVQKVINQLFNNLREK